MQRNLAETVLGAAVLLVAAAFLAYFSRNVGAGHVDGYTVTAAFTKVDGLETGTPVRVGGITVGKVTGLQLNPDTYQAEVSMAIDDGVKLPLDTGAVIASAGLLDGKFLSLEPGADEETLKDGDRIEFTQSPPGLEQLLGQVIFSLTKDDKKDDAPAKPRGAAPPAPPARPASVPDMP